MCARDGNPEALAGFTECLLSTGHPADHISHPRSHLVFQKVLVGRGYNLSVFTILQRKMLTLPEVELLAQGHYQSVAPYTVLYPFRYWKY